MRARTVLKPPSAAPKLVPCRNGMIVFAGRDGMRRKARLHGPASRERRDCLGCDGVPGRGVAGG
jgi:hypothetical protein